MPIVDNPSFISMKVRLVLFHSLCDLRISAGNVQINWNEFDSDFSPSSATPVYFNEADIPHSPPPLEQVVAASVQVCPALFISEYVLQFHTRFVTLFI